MAAGVAGMGEGRRRIVELAQLALPRRHTTPRGERKVSERVQANRGRGKRWNGQKGWFTYAISSCLDASGPSESIEAFLAAASDSHAKSEGQGPLGGHTSAMRRSDEMESMAVVVVLMAVVGGRRFSCVKFDKIASFLLFCCFSRCSSLLTKLTKRRYFDPRKS